jgi:hypothetical protein
MTVEWLVKDHLILVGCIQLVITALLISGFKYWNNLKALSALASSMEAIPRSLITDKQKGFVEIEGKAIGIKGKTLLSPITQRPCIFWEVKAVSFSSNHTLRIFHSENPFFVRDKSGTAMVCQDKRTKIISETIKCVSLELTASTYEKNRDLLKSGGIDGPSGDIRLLESIITENDPLYLTGNMISIPGKFSLSIAKDLSTWDVDTFAGRLERRGLLTAWDRGAVPLSLSGNKILNVAGIGLMGFDTTENQHNSQYLFGTPDSNLFISSITETMVEGDKCIDMYKIPDKSMEFLCSSILIFLLLALGSVEWKTFL